LSTLSNTCPMETSIQIICQKYPKNMEGVVYDPNYKDLLYRPNMLANEVVLNELVMSGMKPKWYGVIHFNDGGDSKKQQYRRLDKDEVEKDVVGIKQALYEEVYGKRWRKKLSRAKSIWGIEYGQSKIKPHINLIIEDLPYPYNDFKSSYVLLDRILPMKCRCLWKRSSHLQPVNCTKGISQYVSKESDFRNATILHSITDNYIK